MKSLVLAEKPSVAKEIARVLGCTQKQKNYYEGPKYVVTWALGHLITLAEPEDYDPKYRAWNLEDLPILPEKMELKVMKETSHQFRAINQLSKRKDLQEFIIATDAGREGELVARWIMEKINWRKPFKRLWISSQTDQAIRDGFSKLKPGKQYDSLYESAVCRAEADWLIGLNVTRALTSRYNAQLAAGRVQTPTLGMIIEREQEIKRFKPVPYYTLSINLGTFLAKWRSRGESDGRLYDREKAILIEEKIKGNPATVEKLHTVEKRIPQPLAYDLTELQRDANRRFGFSAKQTSSVLQRLYENHKLVTYPRTDSRYLTSDMVPTLKGRLAKIAVGPYAGLVKPLLQTSLPITKRIVDDSKVTDHHAIIPTEQPVQLGALSQDERKLYDLIVKRFIALFYPNYRFNETSISIKVADEIFLAKGKVLIEGGWKDVYSLDGSDIDDETENDETDLLAKQQLPKLSQGQTLKIVGTKIDNHMTRPPLRYTEATLLTQMEKHNLGTPATRADIIEKLLQTDTIERKQNQLFPTGKGEQLIELVSEELRSPELTAEWEQELERIAKGGGNRKSFISNIQKQTINLVKEIKNSTIVYTPHNLTHSKCSQCGQPMLEIKSKRGNMLVCSDRTCGHRRPAQPILANKRCPQCHKKMELREGKAGKYVHCRRCNVIEMLGEGGNRIDKRQKNQLIKKYSDHTSLSTNLGELLKAALKEKKDE